MKIAYTGWTWFVGGNEKKEFEQFLKEAKDTGYDVAENFSFISRFFDNNAEEVDALLKKYGIEMANLYLHYSGDDEADYQKATSTIDFMKKIGSTYMNLQGVMWEGDPFRPQDSESIKKIAALSNRIGALCKENGIVACFHPHCNTDVFTEADLDLFCACTDPALVGLCLDTAHTTIAGMDAEKAFDKFGDRIVYVHLKDVDPDPEKAPMARFSTLGYGTVDFRGALRSLRKHGYDGVLCVELDNPEVCNYKSARDSRAFIRNTLGL